MDGYPLHRDDVIPRTDYTNGCRCPAATNARRIHQNRYYAGYRRIISAVGATRRIQALSCMGYSVTMLAERSTISWNTLRVIRRGNRNKMYPATWKEVARLYEELADLPVPPGRESTRARTDAARNGYISPEGWGWVNIDDPAAEPQTVRHGNTLSTVDRMSEYVHLVQCGMSEYEARQKLDLLDNVKFGIYMARYRKAQEAAA